MMLNQTGRDRDPPLGRGQTDEGRQAPWGCAAGAPYRGTASPPPPPVCTALCVHRLLSLPPSLWPLKEQDYCGGYRPPFLCTALCMHRLVCASPCVCTDLYVDYAPRQSPPPPVRLVSAPPPRVPR